MNYSTQVDMWSIGMITVFLLLPDSRHDLQHFKRFCQEQLDEHLQELLQAHAEHGGPIDAPAIAFIERCLKIDHKVRLTASEAKQHAWFEGIHDTRDYQRIRKQTADPHHRMRQIAPPVEELPDVLTMTKHDRDMLAAAAETRPLRSPEATIPESQSFQAGLTPSVSPHV